MHRFSVLIWSPGTLSDFCLVIIFLLYHRVFVRTLSPINQLINQLIRRPPLRLLHQSIIQSSFFNAFRIGVASHIGSIPNRLLEWDEFVYRRTERKRIEQPDSDWWSCCRRCTRKYQELRKTKTVFSHWTKQHPERCSVNHYHTRPISSCRRHNAGCGKRCGTNESCIFSSSTTATTTTTAP